MVWLDLLFPKKCVGCGKVGKYVCCECEVGLWEEEQICPVCTRLSRYGLRHKYCNEPYSLDGLTCLWAYEGVARKIIQKAKYKFCFDLLKELIHDDDSFYFLAKFLQEKPVVVAVPLYKGRERWRGFNQAEVVGKMVADLWGLEFKNVLKRIRDTGQQVGKKREDRLKNIAGAFQVNGKLPKNILLVDDVWTSGATMRECGRVLKKAGAKKVWGLVLAR